MPLTLTPHRHPRPSAQAGGGGDAPRHLLSPVPAAEGRAARRNRPASDRTGSESSNTDLKRSDRRAAGVAGSSRHVASKSDGGAKLTAVDYLLGAAASLGFVSLGWFVISMIFGLSLVSFATGSMQPTIPTGSVGVVRQVTAAELRIGDVVTLQRDENSLPVTHRVVAVDSDPTSASFRLVTMQGDDNPVPDQEPYRVDRGKLVIFSIPGAAIVTSTLGNPLVLAFITIVAALVILWAFWPRAGLERTHERAHRMERIRMASPPLAVRRQHRATWYV